MPTDEQARIIFRALMSAGMLDRTADSVSVLALIIALLEAIETVERQRGA